MGSGVALAIRNKWPQVYERYKIHCHPKHHGTADIIQINDELYVANCYTQHSYGRDGQRYADPEAIRSSLGQVFVFADMFNFLNVYGPRIGCGLGGLTFEKDVQPIFEELLGKYPNVILNICDLPKKRI